MPRQADLPPIFSLYAGRVSYVQEVSSTEFSSSCPACGGDVHPGGEWPDRCRWFVDTKSLGWCRRCASIFWPDADGKSPLSQEEIAAFRRQQEEREEARRRSAERALALLRDDRLWERYHEQLDDQARRYWASRGVPSPFQDWWRLGWDRAHRFGPHITDTATIPLFDPDWKALNIKHRLIVPGTSGKYRYELSGCGQPPFLCNPDADMGGHIIAVEGEVKAMVTHVILSDTKACIAGLPGATPGADVVEMLARAGRVTLVMDPGARQQAWDLTGKIGRAKCRVLIPPMKIDDGLLASQIGKRDLEIMLRTARPAA